MAMRSSDGNSFAREWRHLKQQRSTRARGDGCSSIDHMHEGRGGPSRTDRHARADDGPSSRGNHARKDKDEREGSSVDAKKLRPHARLQRANRNGKKHLST